MSIKVDSRVSDWIDTNFTDVTVSDNVIKGTDNQGVTRYLKVDEAGKLITINDSEIMRGILCELRVISELLNEGLNCNFNLKDLRKDLKEE